MTTLEKLKLLAKKLLERESYTDNELTAFLSTYGLSGTETVDSTNEDNIWLAYADLLEAYLVSAVDYKQGEIDESLDRNTIQEQISEIRRRHSVAELRDIYDENAEVSQQ